MALITDLYKTLFGRKGMSDGSVIDMAEHGRAGGVSTGQGFKFTDSVKSALIADSTTTTNVTYIGKAPIGTATSAASWQIMKVDETVTNVATITWADGNEDFDNIWDNRASLTYS